MSPPCNSIPSTLRLWISRVLRKRHSFTFSAIGVTLVVLFLLVPPPDLDIRSSRLPPPWQPNGPPPRDLPQPPMWADRAQAVKRAFIHAYEPYESIAFPFDELLPLTNSSVNKQVSSNAAVVCGRRPLKLPPVMKLTHLLSDSFNGWGVTAIDSLDTMILMDLKPQTQRVIEHIAKLDFKSAHVRSMLQVNASPPLISFDSELPCRTLKPLLDTLEVYSPHTT